MKSRFVSATIFTLLTVCLIVASIVSSANLTKGKISSLSGPISNVINQIGDKSSIVVPLILDQISKNAEPETVKAINENRTQITQAASALLTNEIFTNDVAQIVDEIGKAVASGQTKVFINPSKLMTTLATEINKAGNSQVIKPSDLATMSKAQQIDLGKAGDVYAKVSSVLSKLLFIWLVVAALLVLLIFLLKMKIFRGLSKVFGSLGLFTLAIWLVIPVLLSKFASSGNDGQLMKELAPIAYRVFAQPAMLIGILYLVLALIFLIAHRMLVIAKPIATAQPSS